MTIQRPPPLEPDFSSKSAGSLLTGTLLADEDRELRELESIFLPDRLAPVTLGAGFSEGDGVPTEFTIGTITTTDSGSSNVSITATITIILATVEGIVNALTTGKRSADVFNPDAIAADVAKFPEVTSFEDLFSIIREGISRRNVEVFQADIDAAIEAGTPLPEFAEQGFVFAEGQRESFLDFSGVETGEIPFRAIFLAAFDVIAATAADFFARRRTTARGLPAPPPAPSPPREAGPFNPATEGFLPEGVARKSIILETFAEPPPPDPPVTIADVFEGFLGIIFPTRGVSKSAGPVSTAPRPQPPDSDIFGGPIFTFPPDTQEIPPSVEEPPELITTPGLPQPPDIVAGPEVDVEGTLEALKETAFVDALSRLLARFFPPSAPSGQAGFDFAKAVRDFLERLRLLLLAPLQRRDGGAAGDEGGAFAAAFPPIVALLLIGGLLLSRDRR